VAGSRVLLVVCLDERLPFACRPTPAFFVLLLLFREYRCFFLTLEPPLFFGPCFFECIFALHYYYFNQVPWWHLSVPAGSAARVPARNAGGHVRKVGAEAGKKRGFGGMEKC
jgi:hypothetical protein